MNTPLPSSSSSLEGTKISSSPEAPKSKLEELLEINRANADGAMDHVGGEFKRASIQFLERYERTLGKK